MSFVCGECGRQSTKSSSSEVCVSCESDYQRGRHDPEWAFNSDPEDLSTLSIFEQSEVHVHIRRIKPTCSTLGCKEDFTQQFNVDVDIESKHSSERIIDCVTQIMEQLFRTQGPVCQGCLDRHIQAKIDDNTIHQMLEVKS